MKSWPGFLYVSRSLLAFMPFMLIAFVGLTYAQSRDLESRLSAVEITEARHDERFVAIVSRLDSIDKTLLWVISATTGGTFVSAIVAADRAAFKYRLSRGKPTGE